MHTDVAEQTGTTRTSKPDKRKVRRQGGKSSLSPQRTDEELMRHFQSGDELAYGVLVNRFKERIYNFILRYGVGAETAEDITQETFLRLYTKKHLYKELAKVSTWVFTIAKKLTFSELRKRKQRRTYSISDLGLAEQDFEFPSEHNLEAELSMEVTETLVQQALQTLSPSYRSVVLLRDLQHLSYQEIGEIMGIAEGTVKSRINRGRLQLREALLPHLTTNGELKF